MPVHGPFFYTAAFNSGTYAALGVSSSDPLMLPNTTNKTYTPNRDMLLLGGAAGGTMLLRARVEAASATRVAYPQLVPVQSSAITLRACRLVERPFKFLAGEPISLTAINGGANATAGVLLFGFDLEPPPPGEAVWMRFSGSVAATAGTPALVASADVSWEQNYVSGTYAIIGMDAYATNLIALRAVLAGFNYRPAVISHGSSPEFTPDPLFTQGDMGVMGYFTNQQTPGFEILSNATETVNFAGALLVIRIGGTEMLPSGR
jgi:hypothetical protein